MLPTSKRKKNKDWIDFSLDCSTKLHPSIAPPQRACTSRVVAHYFCDFVYHFSAFCFGEKLMWWKRSNLMADSLKPSINIPKSHSRFIFYFFSVGSPRWSLWATIKLCYVCWAQMMMMMIEGTNFFSSLQLTRKICVSSFSFFFVRALAIFHHRFHAFSLSLSLAQQSTKQSTFNFMFQLLLRAAGIECTDFFS